MKYVGSKAKIKKDIISILQKIIDENNITNYIEPFVGGANIIDDIKCDNKIGYDNEEILIELLNECKANSDFLNELPELPTKEHYYEVRDNIENKYSKAYQGAILFFASYNAKINGGYGAFANTKDGKIRNYFQEAKRNLEKQLNSLKDIKFVWSDYKNIELPKNKSLIYCDIPYESSMGKMYNTEDTFNHKEFWQWVRDNSKNHIIVVSEYNAPDDFKCIWEKEHITNMNNRDNQQKKVEKMFIYDGK